LVYIPAEDEKNNRLGNRIICNHLCFK